MLSDEHLHSQSTTVNFNATSTTNSDASQLPTSNCSTNASDLCINTTSHVITTSTAASNYELLLPASVVIVIVLAAACLLLGVVYGYLYFTRESATNNKEPYLSLIHISEPTRPY